MTYISRCEHGTPMALCQKCFPDVSEHNDWSNYKYTQPVKELTDEEIMDEVFRAGLAVSKDTDVFLLEHDVEAFIVFAKAILRKAQEK